MSWASFSKAALMAGVEPIRGMLSRAVTSIDGNYSLKRLVPLAFTLVTALCADQTEALGKSYLVPSFYLFVTEVPSDRGCFIKTFGFLDQQLVDEAPYPPSVSFGAWATLVFKDGERRPTQIFTSSNTRGGQVSFQHPYPFPCGSLDYIEITDADCRVHYLDQFGNLDESSGAGTYENKECLGKLPRRVGVAGTLTNDPNILLPLAPEHSPKTK